MKPEEKEKSEIQKPSQMQWFIGGMIAAVGLILIGVWIGKNVGKHSEQPETELPFNRKSGLEMVPVEGGTFMMGSPETEAGRDEDECQHQRTVQDFKIGKYEVTQADWREIMGSNPSHFQNCDDCPVENVSWDDIQEFLNKLNQKTGKIYRLPTEAEWEFAARDGKKSKGLVYSGSNDMGEVGWFWENSGNQPLSGEWDYDKVTQNNCRTHPVGSKKANELGIYDMSGNVFEWCQDTYKPYSCDSKTSSNEKVRVLRGGSWNHFINLCRVAGRIYIVPSERYINLGFRLAQD